MAATLEDPGSDFHQDMCSDPDVGPAPFTYFVWQKGSFHPFPLTVGILSSLNFIIMLLILFKK